jgi:2-isopropylmalate synthase
MAKITIYDTTLRDGEQAEEISFSVEDKLLIARKLDELGVHYIEGGYPGANPRDEEFFRRAGEIGLAKASLAAFGATHKPGTSPEKDRGIKGILEAGVATATIFGKTWDFHVEHALKVSLRENLALIHDTIGYLKKRLDTVFFDAEHFFDGYAQNPKYALKCLKAALDAGADCLVLCDTNGGALPDDVRKVTSLVKRTLKSPVGIHAHNDSDCAVASSVLAVQAGARHVQGTVNGLGERTGNANLCSIVPNLQIKLGHKCMTEDQLARMRDVSRFVNELANIMHFKRQPYVGDSAFAHKAGMHVSAILKSSETYEHIRPELVGNSQRVLVSDLAGRSNIIRKAAEFGIKVNPKSPKLQKVVERLKDLEGQGFQFEGAEGSFELMMKKALGKKWKFFDLVGFRVFISKRREGEAALHESTVMIKTPDGKVLHTVGGGNGPVNALDNALRKALVGFYPELREVKLLDYKVRVLSPGRGTAANVRVLIESGDGVRKWNTVGMSEDVVEASYQALVDSIEYKLLKERGE